MNLLASVLLAALASGLVPATVGGDDPSSYYGSQSIPLVREGELLVYGPGRILVSDFSLADHLGSVRDQDSEYAPFGSGGQRFAGHPYDYDVALYQTPGRHLDPSLGRFLSIDLNRQGASPYVYVANDPVGHVDPSGDVLTPYFMQSNMDPTDNFSTTRGIMELLGAAKNMSIVSDYHFRGKPITDTPGSSGGFTSPASRAVKRAMKGKLQSGEYKRTEEFYWIMGGDKEVTMPDELVPMLKKMSGMQEGSLSRIIILDFTGKGMGVINQGRLRRMGRESIVVEANIGSMAWEVTKNGYVATSFGVRDGRETVPMDRHAFRDHVYGKIAERWGTPPQLHSLPPETLALPGAQPMPLRGDDSPPPRKKTKAAGSQMVTEEPELSTENIPGLFFKTYIPED